MKDFSEKIESLLHEVSKLVIGQEDVKRDIIIALLAGGHILLEGAPGLAKTKSVTTFASALNLDFKRIQFTPDLLPSDLIGAKIYDPESKQFEIKKGPIFSNFILADEINRAPSKVQSALLECMEERQVTIGEETFQLDVPFIVLATQNPLEQEGTFHLPEAQLDRFLLKTLIDYPTAHEEKKILQGFFMRENYNVQKVFSQKDLLNMKKYVDQVEVSESIYEYICRITLSSRDTTLYPEIVYGASPRASLALMKCAMVLAAISGRNFVLPEDIKCVAAPVLRHRIILSYEAQAEGISVESIIEKILLHVKVS